MPRSDRLFDLIQILRDGRLHRAAELAMSLGVSTRSIWRDMGVLAASGMPVEGERGVGYILRTPLTLPPMMLSPAEMLALRHGVRLVAEGSDAALAAAARSLAAKIATVAPAPREEAEDLFTATAAEALRPGPQLPVLRKAIRQAERLTLAVLDVDGQLTQRDIRPLTLSLAGRVWTLGAWIEGAGFATFGLDRVLEVVPRGQTFPSEPGTRLKDYRRWREGQTEKVSI